MNIDTNTAVTAVGSTIAASTVITYLARLFFERMVKQNDEKHKEHENKFSFLIDRFNDTILELKTKLAVLEVTVADAKNMRSDIKLSEKELAVVIKTADKAHKRIDDLKDGVARIHSDIERLEQSIGGKSL